MKSAAFFLLMLTIGIVVLVGDCSALSVGVSPGTLTFSDLLRSGYAEQEVLVSTSGGKVLIGQITARTSEIADWLSFEPSTFEIPPRGVIRVKAIVNPPSDAANGNHTGMIDVKVVPKEKLQGEGTYLGVGVAAGIKTTVIITDRQIKRYTYKDLVVKDIEEGNPIEVKFLTINTGNVRVRPQIKVEILDQMRKNVVKSVDYSEVELLPTARQEMLITILTDDLKLGQYWARVTLSMDGQQIGQELVTFDYLERGALRVKGVLNSVRSGVWVQVGDTARMDAIFSNIGEMVTLAKAKFQIFLNGALKDVVDSEEVRVEVGETMNMTAFYKPLEVGKYEIVGTVFYSGKISEEKSTILNVNERVTAASVEQEVEEVQPSGGLDLIWIILVVVIIVIVLLLVRLMNTRRRGGGRQKRSGLSGY